MPLFRRLLTLPSVLLLVAGAAQAQGPAAPPALASKPIVVPFTQFTLANGLRVWATARRFEPAVKALNLGPISAISVDEVMR